MPKFCRVFERNNDQAVLYREEDSGGSHHVVLMFASKGGELLKIDIKCRNKKEALTSIDENTSEKVWISVDAFRKGYENNFYDSTSYFALTK